MEHLGAAVLINGAAYSAKLIPGGSTDEHITSNPDDADNGENELNHFRFNDMFYSEAGRADGSDSPRLSPNEITNISGSSSATHCVIFADSGNGGALTLEWTSSVVDDCAAWNFMIFCTGDQGVV